MAAIRQRRSGEVVLACLGLAFKANIDDLRESPSLEITRHLVERGLADRTLVVEPYLEQMPPALAGLTGTEFATLEAALEGADVIVLLVDHLQFKDVPRHRLEGKAVIDTRGLWR